jgi:hypothetical protein
MFEKVKRKLYELIQNPAASQMIEEALLLGVSFTLLAIVLGVVNGVGNSLSTIFNESLKNLQNISQGLFGWLKPS